MFIHSFVFPKKIIIILILLCIIGSVFCLSFWYVSKNNSDDNVNIVTESDENIENNISDSNNTDDSQITEKKDFIKWVDFNVTTEALNKTANLDITSHQKNENVKYNWIELLAYLACKNGGNFKNFKTSDLDALVTKLKNGNTIEDLTSSMKYYNYYYESYSAVLGGFIGDYSVDVTNNNDSFKSYEKKYGLKAFLPIAKNYSFSHYDDFGNSRSYGFKRTHLGNDLMGSIGTPIIAVESGTIEHLGWNQFGRLENWN